MKGKKEDDAKSEKKELEVLYKNLAVIKDAVDNALSQASSVANCDTLAEAAFKAGKASVPLSMISDKLENILEELYSKNDFEHYEDIILDLN